MHCAAAGGKRDSMFPVSAGRSQRFAGLAARLACASARGRRPTPANARSPGGRADTRVVRIQGHRDIISPWWWCMHNATAPYSMVLCTPHARLLSQLLKLDDRGLPRRGRRCPLRRLFALVNASSISTGAGPDLAPFALRASLPQLHRRPLRPLLPRAAQRPHPQNHPPSRPHRDAVVSLARRRRRHCRCRPHACCASQRAPAVHALRRPRRPTSHRRQIPPLGSSCPASPIRRGASRR